MRRLLLALGAATLLGCADSSGPGDTDPVGTWNLVYVNDSRLPFTLDEVAGSYRLELLSDQLVIVSNGTFTGATRYRETEGTIVTTSTDLTNGTWTEAHSPIHFDDPARDVVTLTYSDGSVWTGDIGGNAIIGGEPDLVFTYRRQ